MSYEREMQSVSNAIRSDVRQTAFKSCMEQISSGTVPFGRPGVSVGIFEAKKISGDIHVGLSYVSSGSFVRPGQRFHYDHGVGIHKNEDAQYLWVAPITNDLITSISNKMSSEFSLGPAMLITNGGRFLSGEATVIPSGVVEIKSTETNEIIIVEDVLGISPLPIKAHPIWKGNSVKPLEEQEIIAWIKGDDVEPVFTKYLIRHGDDGGSVNGIDWNEGVSSWASKDEMAEFLMNESIQGVLGAHMNEDDEYGPR